MKRDYSNGRNAHEYELTRCNPSSTTLALPRFAQRHPSLSQGQQLSISDDVHEFLDGEHSSVGSVLLDPHALSHQRKTIEVQAQ